MRNMKVRTEDALWLTSKLLLHLMWKLWCHGSYDPDSNSLVNIPRNYCHLILTVLVKHLSIHSSLRETRKLFLEKYIAHLTFFKQVSLFSRVKWNSLVFLFANILFFLDMFASGCLCMVNPFFLKLSYWLKVTLNSGMEITSVVLRGKVKLK